MNISSYSKSISYNSLYGSLPEPRLSVSGLPYFTNKSNSKPPHPAAVLEIGDIVYLYDDRSKLIARPRYLVVGFEDEFCLVRRLCEKMMGAKSYKVKPRECYKVEDEFKDMVLPPYPYQDESVPATVLDESLDEDCESDEEIYSSSEDEDEESISTESAEETSSSDEDQSATEDAAEDTSGSDEDTRRSDISYSENSQNDSAQEYPCGMCHKEVSQEESALLCDTCGDWCHILCGKIKDEEYDEFQAKYDADESITWDCPACMDKEEEDPPYQE